MRIADHASRIRHVFVRDMVLLAKIGAYPEELNKNQTVRINLDLGVDDDTASAGLAVGADELDRVVDYGQIVDRLRRLVGAGHTKLVETLAERIAEMCLNDPRVQIARVRVEKMNLAPDILSLGVEIERRRDTVSGL